MKNLVSLKSWGKRLHGKDSAIIVRNLCLRKLDPERPLILNMSGVKDCTPGFAYECFGMLYLAANRKGARIKFEGTNDELRPIILSAIQAALR